MMYKHLQFAVYWLKNLQAVYNYIQLKADRNY